MGHLLIGENIVKTYRSGHEQHQYSMMCQSASAKESSFR